jgi:tetratricopeptide (TPR) repeat protein
LNKFFGTILIISILICIPAIGQQLTASQWIEKGDTLYKNGSYELAADCYAKALDIDPSDIYCWNMKGLCFYSLNRSERMQSSVMTRVSN